MAQDGPSFGTGCRDCGAAVVPDARFCSRCGARLARATGAGAVGGGDAMHPLVTLFCDVVDSTALATRLDPEDWRALLDDFEQAVRKAAVRFGGHVARVVGDGVLIYFGWPEAHEDDAERAVLAGLAILEAMAALNRSPWRGERPPLQLRLGAHVGMTLVNDAGEAFGETPHVASRAQAATEPDTLAVTDALYALAGARFETEDAGERRFKGVDRPVRLHRVLRARDGAPHDAPGETPFVGRESELGALAEQWDRAQRGSGGTVVVSGEAGVGKSRLIREFRRHALGAPHHWMEARGAPFFRATSLHPLVTMLRSALDVRDAADAAAAARLEAMLRSCGVSGRDELAVVAELLGLSGEAVPPSPLLAEDRKRSMLLEVLASGLIGRARDRPAILLMEDAHWFDPSTTELVTDLARRAPDAAFMLVITTRAAEGDFSRAVHVALERLPGPAIRALTAPLLGAGVSAATADAIVARSEGVPLVAEELARAAGETVGGLPRTLAASFTARLARLGAAQEVAHLCAVLGTGATRATLLAAGTASAEELEAALDSLVAARVLRAEGSPEDPAYRFRHALYSDAAYEMLLGSRRRGLHRRVAAVLRERFPSISEGQPEVMARHWTAAREPDLAVAAWKAAAAQAQRRRAFAEAGEAYRQAIALIEGQAASAERDEKELELRFGLLAAEQIALGYAAAIEGDNGRRLRGLIARGGDAARMTTLAASVWAALSTAGDYGAAARMADEVSSIAERGGGSEALAFAHMAQLTARSRIGDLAGAERHFLAGEPHFSIAAFAKRPGAVQQAYGNAAKVAGLLGRADVSLARSAFAIEAAVAGGSPYDLAFAEHMAASNALSIRDPARALGHGRRSVELSDKHAYPQFAAIARVVVGRAVAELESAPEGIALIRRGIDGMARNGARAALTMYLVWLGEAYALNGALDDALTEIERALQINPQERIYRAEALRLRGELRLRNGDYDRAESDAREALATAVSMGAVRFRLRSAVSLARLLSERRRPADARAALASAEVAAQGPADDPDVVDFRACRAMLPA